MFGSEAAGLMASTSNEVVVMVEVTNKKKDLYIFEL